MIVKIRIGQSQFIKADIASKSLQGFTAEDSLKKSLS